MDEISELIRRSRQGDREAFGRLVELYQDRVYTQCFHLAQDRQDAQDLAQDVFIQAFRSVGSFRNQADFGTWLHRIAVNLWINRCRKKKPAVAFSLDEPLESAEGEVRRELAAEEDSPLEQLERREERALLNRALKELPAEYRTVLVLRELEGYSYEEIAGATDCSLGTVKSRLSRGRRALRKAVDRLLGRGDT